MRRPDVTLSTQDNQFESPDFAKVISSQMSLKLGSERFELWFPSSNCFRVSDFQVFIFADSGFALKQIQNKFSNELREVVDRVCGDHFQLRYRIGKAQPDSQISEPENKATILSLQPSTTTRSNHSTPRDVRPPESHHSNGQSVKTKPTLRSFCFGKENRMLEAAIYQTFELPGQFSPLFIYGPTGSGKSLLLEIIAHEFRRRLNKRKCLFVSSEQFTTQFVASLRGGAGLPVFRSKYRNLDLLVIDDVQFFAGKKATLGEFQQTLDDLIRNGTQVILSADRNTIELGHLGSDICNRLSGGMSCPIHYPDLNGRMMLARKACQERGLSIPNSVLSLVCEQLKRDVRRIYGAVNRLYAYSIGISKDITPDVAVKLLKDLFAFSGPNCSSMVSIEQETCDICGVRPTELRSPSRKKGISSARMLAMYLSRRYTGSAFSEIGDYFGGRSHSTVIAAVKKVEKWLKEDVDIKLPHAICSVREVVQRIESKLRIG
ncbi:MAG: DnaA/Hda family protein [Planctomycetota bacterium]